MSNLEDSYPPTATTTTETTESIGETTAAPSVTNSTEEVPSKNKKENELAVIDSNQPGEIDGAGGAKKDARFWAIIVSLLLATFLAALDLTSISTALPTIANDLHSTDYAWIANSYSITSTAIVPWAGGLASLFGRRSVMMVGLVSFFVGSALCGAAQNINVMITGRSFQGIGSGIILCVSEIILSDLVSLSERGAFQGAFGAVWSLASAVGPPIGGAWASTNWRGLFYMNLPLGAGIMLIIGLFVNLKTPAGTVSEKLKRMDWFGNLVFIPSITLFIVGLLSGGQTNPWISANVLAPLIIGALGLVLWYCIERFYADHPTVPFELLSNRTSLIGYATTFLHGISALALFYFLPVSYQAVRGASPTQSAVDFFTVAFITAPFSMIAGGSISATQIYYPQNIVAWVLMIIGPAIMTLIHFDTSRSTWLALPIPFAAGVGLLYAATTFPVLAPLPPSLAGKALAFLVFCRNLGNILGITIGSTVLANELGQKLPASYLASLPGGVASAYSAIPGIPSLPEPLQTEVRIAFAESIRVIWIVLIPFGVIGLLTAVWMKAYPLGTVTDDAWGLEHGTALIDEEKVQKNVE